MKTQATLTITANNSTRIYGSTITLSNTQFSDSGLVNSDTVSSVTLTSAGAASGAGVGNYAIVASAAVGSGLSNYAINYVNGSLTVTPAPLTVTAVVIAIGLFDRRIFSADERARVLEVCTHYTARLTAAYRRLCVADRAYSAVVVPVAHRPLRGSLPSVVAGICGPDHDARLDHWRRGIVRRDLACRRADGSCDLCIAPRGGVCLRAGARLRLATDRSRSFPVAADD